MSPRRTGRRGGGGHRPSRRAGLSAWGAGRRARPSRGRTRLPPSWPRAASDARGSSRQVPAVAPSSMARAARRSTRSPDHQRGHRGSCRCARPRRLSQPSGSLMEAPGPGAEREAASWVQALGLASSAESPTLAISGSGTSPQVQVGSKTAPGFPAMAAAAPVLVAAFVSEHGCPAQSPIAQIPGTLSAGSIDRDEASGVELHAGSGPMPLPFDGGRRSTARRRTRRSRSCPRLRRRRAILGPDLIALRLRAEVDGDAFFFKKRPISLLRSDSMPGSAIHELDDADRRAGLCDERVRARCSRPDHEHPLRQRLGRQRLRRLRRACHRTRSRDLDRGRADCDHDVLRDEHLAFPSLPVTSTWPGPMTRCPEGVDLVVFSSPARRSSACRDAFLPGDELLDVELRLPAEIPISSASLIF